MVLLEALPAIYNRYVAHEPFAYLSWHTVSENFKAGFGYDSDHFSINQSSHPLHGSLYFNAARSNGYDYWESALFTAAGSVVWELTMENTRPSVNDLVNTTLGGMTRGEVSHRLAAVIRDNMASGSDRFWRELGAAVLDPVGAFSRLVHGEMTSDFPNPEERYPDGFSVTSDVGYRHVNGATDDPDQALVSLSARYGDPFTGDIEKPFDSFWAGIDLNFPAAQAISRIEERGVLKGWELTDRTAAARHIFGFSQEYEYFNNAAQVFGAQTLSAGLLSRWALSRSLFAVTDFSVLAIPLAGIQTTNFTNPQTGRNYDYAPGGGLASRGTDLRRLGGAPVRRVRRGLGAHGQRRVGLEHAAVLPCERAHSDLRRPRRGRRLLVVQPRDDLHRIRRAAPHAVGVESVSEPDLRPFRTSQAEGVNPYRVSRSSTASASA